MSKWLHSRKGVIEGELISDDGTWTRIRIKGDQELRSAKPGRKLRLEDEEYIDVRTSFLTLITSPALEIWETEDAMLVIWGTHDPNHAYGAAVGWYEAHSEVPDGLASEILDVTVTGAGELWADPAVRDIEESPWPAWMWSRTPVEGWTPYMVVCW